MTRPGDETPSRSAFRPEVRRVLPALIVLRLVVNTGGRMVFTFLPEFSRGTGLTIDELGRLLTIRDLTGLAAPLFGRRSDRSGSRSIMLGGAALTAVGFGLFTLGSIGVVVGIVLWGFGRTSYHVAMNAWVGNEVAYERRGRATGQVEMTWAGSALIGIPAMGLLIERLGWRAAPLALAALTVPLTALLATRLTETTSPSTGSGAPARWSPTMVTTLATFALLSGSVQFLVFGHGVWLEETYGFDPAQVGFAIVAIGLAELASSYASSRWTDRYGKRNSFIAGTLVLTVGSIGLASVEAPPLALGLGLLVVAFLGFEFAIVSAIPMVAELDPSARAQTIGRAIGLSIVARASGSLLASWLIVERGFRSLVVIAAVLAAVTAVLSTFLMVEPDGGPVESKTEAA